MKTPNVERVTGALQHDRRSQELRRSLQNPHPETAELAKQGLRDWARGLPEEDTEALVDSRAGKPVQWSPGAGWLALKN